MGERVRLSANLKGSLTRRGKAVRKPLATGRVAGVNIGALYVLGCLLESPGPSKPILYGPLRVRESQRDRDSKGRFAGNAKNGPHVLRRKVRVMSKR